ncbi:CHAT domain-containing protein [Boletus edulis BED1]|uniref:CHAT domain-containing protein n=1 Tax=Boletus edulis BED1 TaxID=1328754 RepID=A0AAD4BQG3_BOLED|nr:CHAT domain-containing protein [Boletus edulis BED1]
MASKLDAREKRPQLESRMSQSRVPTGDSTGHEFRGNEETVITCTNSFLYMVAKMAHDEVDIRATDVVLGLRRFPARFYTVVRHSGLEWRTENKRSSVQDDVVEWNKPLPMRVPLLLTWISTYKALRPSDPSATVCLEVYASFECQPMLGTGERLRKLTVTVQQLLDRSEKHIPFVFFPKDGSIVSPCSSIVVTVERRDDENNDSLISRVLDPPCSTTNAADELEDTTNRGHSALSRYRKHGERRDLERSVAEFERALDTCGLNHPCHAAAQSNLATAKFILCQVDDTNASFDIPIGLYRSALATRPLGHADRRSTLIQLAAVHLARFEKQGDEDDGARVEALLYEAMGLSATDSHEKRAVAFMLQLYAKHRIGPGQSSVDSRSGSRLTEEDPLSSSVQLLECFKRYGDLADLQRGITLLQKMIRSVSVWDDRYCAGLGNLGVALLWRFKRLGGLRDLEDAISTLRDAVVLTPHGHPDTPTWLNNLGNCFVTRFERLGELSDLADAISTLRDAVVLTPHGHPDKPTCLNNLGLSFITRFKHLGELRDLEDAISTLRDAVLLTPHGHPHKPNRLNNLGLCFITRFECLGELRDLEDGILTHRDAVVLAPHGHPDKPSCLSNLAPRELRDLEDSISTLRDAVVLTPHGHPVKSTCLNNFGLSIITRFERLGELSDLEDGISTLRDAVVLTPHGHPDKPGCLNNLGSSFITRFKHLGELRDLEDAISTLRDAVVLTPHGHPDKPSRLNNLGAPSSLDGISTLRDAVVLTLMVTPTSQVLRDLEDAISTLRDAVVLTPHGHPHRPGHMNNLGVSFKARFEQLGELRDLEDAISTLRDAVHLTPHGHPHKPNRLNNLGLSLKARFERLGELSDLEDGISTLRDAVVLMPHGHTYKPSMLSNLGLSFITRFEHLGELSDLEDAVSLYSHSASLPIGSISVRFRASRIWILCARRIRHPSLLRAYSIAINLLPQVAWIGLSLTHRYAELKRGADVVREAAAAALDSGFPELAVEWLEQGRSIVWGELLQLRGSYEQLSSTHPDHARRLRDLSAALDHAGATREKSLSTFSESTDGAIHRAPQTLQQEADRHRTLAIERDKLLQEIRRLPGFERFLLPKDFSQLRASAQSGPVVILNAAECRCDALIVLPDVDHVIHVPLPHFTLKRAADHQILLKTFLRQVHAVRSDERYGKTVTWDRGSWETFLAPLWKGIVQPVLGALAFSTPGDLSRIFWCPTGPLVFLPIHAAGLYDAQYSQPGHKVFDFVVSSYVPTLSMLAPSRSLRAVPNDDFRLLAVLQPPTDGQARLPGVHTELEHIKEVIRNSPPARTTLLESFVGTVEEVLGLMKESDWVHFACHGIQDAASPTESGLCLANGRRLKISDIIALSRCRGGLAFLSACQTATGDEGLSDEAIHIAAGMLFAGYAGVVGTMWSISDKLAPIVARDVYEHLFRNGTRPDYREAARALHEAIGDLRDSGEVSFNEWVPFIHVGF